MPPSVVVCPAPKVISNEKMKPPPRYVYDPVSRRYVRCY